MEKQEKIVSMFNNIAPTYDKANRVLSMGIDKSWRDKACNKTFELYGKKEIAERHRHRFEYNNEYKEKMEEAGLICSGTSPDGRLVEIVELKDHPFFIAGQFHPEFKSRPNRPGPLFKGLIAAAKK